MRIGEVEKLSGCGRHTIRFYEAEGLIEAPRRDGNNYRAYEPAVVDELAFIRSAQDVGFTLGEIRAILVSKGASSFDCLRGAELVDEKIGEVTRRITALRSMKSQLEVMRSGLVDSAVGNRLEVPNRLRKYGSGDGRSGSGSSDLSARKA